MPKLPKFKDFNHFMIKEQSSKILDHPRVKRRP